MAGKGHGFQRLFTRIIYALVAGIGIYLVLAVFFDGRKVAGDLLRFRWFPYMFLILLLSLLNYAIRFGKWSYYLWLSSLRVPTFDSLLIFLASLSMTVTPGKVGELLKAELVKHRTGYSRAVTGTIVIAERLTDLIAIILLAIAGMMSFALDWRVIVAVSLLPVGLLFVVACRPFALLCIDVLDKLPVVGGRGAKLQEAYASIQRLVSPVPLVLMTLVSVLSWGCECLGLYLAVRGFGATVHVLAATAAYAFGTVAGIVTPGGIGPADVSIPLILQVNMAENMESVALAATFIIRLATLWFAVGVGVVALLTFARKYGEQVEQELEHLMEQTSSADGEA